VQLVVGPQELVVTVHEALLCAASKYFQKYLKGGFKESASKTVELPHEDAGTVQTIVSFMYVVAVSEGAARDDMQWINSAVWEANSKTDVWMTKATNVYVLADKWCCIYLRSVILHAVHKLLLSFSALATRELICCLLPPRAVSIAWSQLPEGNPMRRLLVDVWAATMWPYGAASLSDYPQEFLVTAMGAEKARSHVRATMTRSAGGRPLELEDLSSLEELMAVDGYCDVAKYARSGAPDYITFRGRELHLRRYDSDDVWCYCSCRYPGEGKCDSCGLPRETDIVEAWDSNKE
jgi:hypothetical protein